MHLWGVPENSDSANAIPRGACLLLEAHKGHERSWELRFSA